ncbi:TetR/AcrR family transcriptional regulator [Nocardia caishijiensis]|uniref:TetR family transcriptional regulator n=1 Tax=Nocardia caishijiensis TaxID=184756 RepID=A0ABQ6YEN7_9NOCA|nr:TetR/AcrR family transcriptional regulator [Nocardia caishijiensis]KAF0835783.1 TetR family transcriptional regulator [Nocardia caishijiensis]
MTAPECDPTPDHDVDWSTKRSDARRNHERVVAAAVEVFAEHGIEATIPQVAARAGVGKATVYRSFPTKDALVQAVAQYQRAWFYRRGLAAQEQLNSGGDPLAILRDLLAETVERLANDRALAEALPETAKPSPAGEESLESIILAGQRQGVIREDVTARHVRVLLGGVAGSLFRQQERDPEQWRIYGELIFNAVKKA